jgi:hypothetical protein
MTKLLSFFTTQSHKISQGGKSRLLYFSVLLGTSLYFSVLLKSEVLLFPPWDKHVWFYLLPKDMFFASLKILLQYFGFFSRKKGQLGKVNSASNKIRWVRSWSMIGLIWSAFWANRDRFLRVWRVFWQHLGFFSRMKGSFGGNQLVYWIKLVEFYFSPSLFSFGSLPVRIVTDFCKFTSFLAFFSHYLEFSSRIKGSFSENQ